MPFFYINEDYDDLLDEARDVLAKAHEAEAAEEAAETQEDLDALRDDLVALATEFKKHRDRYGSLAAEKINELIKRYKALEAAGDDVDEDEVDRLQDDVDDLAARYDVVLPNHETPDEEPDVAEFPRGTLYQQILGAPDILKGVTPRQIVNFAMASTLLEPPRYSAYHRRQQELSVVNAGLLAVALRGGGGGGVAGPGPRGPTGPAGPGHGGPKDGPETRPGGSGGGGVIAGPPGDDVIDDDDVVDFEDLEDFEDDTHDDDDNDGGDHDVDEHDDDTHEDDDGHDEDVIDDTHEDDDTPDGDTHDDDDDGTTEGGTHTIATDPGGVIHLGHIVEEHEVVVVHPPPLPDPQPVILAHDGQSRLRALIDHHVQGGTAERPDLMGQLAHANIRSPEDLLAFTAKGWTRNINEGRHLHGQLLRVLGAEQAGALPPHDELDRLVKAARREIRGHDHPVA